MPSPRWKWRQELQEQRESLRSAVAHYNRFPKHDMEVAWFPIERSITYSAVCIRKLLELNLCDPKLNQMSVKCSDIASTTGRGFGVVDYGSGHWILDSFDVENPRDTLKRPFEFVSEIIHASYLLPVHDLSDQIRGYGLISPIKHAKSMTIFSSKEIKKFIRRFSEDKYDTITIISEDMTTGEKTKIRPPT